jgi:hypothetical protein
VLVTDPLVHRLQSLRQKGGCGKAAGRVAGTFSGYRADIGNASAISEARANSHVLDREFSNLPAPLAVVSGFDYNGPGLKLSLLGTNDAELHRPVEGRYDLHVAETGRLSGNAVRCNRQLVYTYRLPAKAVDEL